MQYTKDLTKDLNKSIKTLYPTEPSDKMVCVEIGSFEGKGSIVICDYLCQNDTSKLYCIDPFDNEYVKGNKDMSYWNYACNGQLTRFRNNTSTYPKIVECKGYSDIIIPTLENNTVDFVYIDGDHSPEQVYKDAVNMFPKMKRNGIILFDDYLWKRHNIETKHGIDKFLNEYVDKYTLVLKNYQLAIRVL
jgi:predicted O-methyltransferase YrrM